VRPLDGVGKSVDGVGFRPVKLTHPEGFRPRSFVEGNLPPPEGFPPEGLDSPQTSLRQSGKPEGFFRSC
jgi:hypothetical protein